MTFKCGDTVKANGLSACKDWSTYQPFEYLKVISVSAHCLVAADKRENTYIASHNCFELVEGATANV